MGTAVTSHSSFFDHSLSSEDANEKIHTLSLHTFTMAPSLQSLEMPQNEMPQLQNVEKGARVAKI
jgi:hypothetical protein